MKRLFALAAILLAAGTLHAQISYEGCLKRLNIIHSIAESIVPEMFYEAILNTFERRLTNAGTWNEEKKGEIQTLVTEYSRTRFEDDWAALMLPYYKNNISVEDLDHYVTTAERPEVSAALVHIARSTTDQSTLINSVAVMLQPNHKPVEWQGSKEFKDAYEKYYHVSGSKDLTENYFSAVEEVFQGQHMNIPEIEKMLDGVRAELPTLMCNMMVNSGVTLQDLEIVNRTMAMPEFKGIRASNFAITKDAMALSQQLMKLITKFIDERMATQNGGDQPDK